MVTQRYDELMSALNVIAENFCASIHTMLSVFMHSTCVILAEKISINFVMHA